MSERLIETKHGNAALKAGTWYLIGNLINRAFGFITVPVFSRLLAQEDFGQFGNITSWVTILLPIFSLELYVALNRGRFDFSDDVEGFVSSISIFSVFSILLFYLIVVMRIDFFSNLFSIKPFYLHLMFLYFLGYPTYNIFLLLYRYKYDYKNVLILVFLNTIFSMALSIVLVLIMKDRLMGRCIGYTLPTFIIGTYCLYKIFRRKISVKWEYIRYALHYGVPYVPHVLGMHLLSSSDKIMIVRLIGSSDNAIYSVAVSYISIVGILLTSLNQAWAPWSAEKLHNEEYTTIKSISKIYILLFAIACIFVNLFTPEIIALLGGKRYIESADCIPPLLGGIIAQFSYTLYVNTEMYYKKPLMVTIGTLIAALLNIGLNYVLLPRYGYKVAAYTTLFSYFALYMIHAIFLRILKKNNMYDMTTIFIVTILTMIIVFLSKQLYPYILIRLLISAIVVGVLIYLYFCGYINKFKERFGGRIK